MAAYAYDSTGRLRESWDPRTSPALKVAYGYDAAGRVTSMTPPGQLPWTFSYGQAGDPATADDGMLLAVSRPTLTPGSATQTNGTATTSIVYGVPLSGATAPRQLGAGTVAGWGQTDLPTDATAVFPADAVPASHSGSALAATSYGRATLSYLDVSGRTVNAADPAGNITTTEYDKFGNTVRELTAANRALALGATSADTAELAALGIGGLPAAERAEQLSTRSTYNDTGTRELEELAPLHELTLEANLMDGTTTVATAGSRVTARSRTVNEYDAGRPTDATAVAKDQITKATVGAQPRLRPDLLADPRATATTYDWAKGSVTSTVQDPGGLAITNATQYDAQGRVTKTIPPGSTGTDAAATITTYYTATGTAPCGGRAEWADQVCQTLPAGAITGGGANPAQAVTTTTEYGRYGATTAVTETANGVTRTTTTGYDPAERPMSVTVTGGVGTAVPVVTTGYDPATGQATTVTSSTGGTVTTGYDALGRPRTYTDADGATTTTSYDALDRPTTVTDIVPSTTTYAYDTAVEPRGLATAMVDSVAGTFRATYDPDGSVTTEKLPGGYTVTQTEDPTGSATARTYTRDSDGAVVSGDAVGESVHGQWVTHTGTPGQESEQDYTYDKAGRLTTVADTTDVTCTRRTYGFNARSDRTSQSTVTSAPGASVCPTTGAVTTTHTYDSVDRITDTGYGYDALGRTTTSPGTVTTAYYATDLVQQQTAGAARTSWTLDASMRPRGWTTESNTSGTWTATATSLNHYDGSSDEPKWTVENTGTAAITRNVESLSGDLAATTAASSATTTVLQLTNLHGDVSLQLPLDTAVAPTVLAADEYGSPRPGTPAARYGWLGAKQRSAETPTGMVLMGVRVYNPATGRFLQTDPEPGGSCNDYDYTCADPVNAYDLDGRRCWSCGFRSAARWAGRHKVDIALTAVSFVPGLGQAAWAYRGYRAYRAYRGYRAYRAVRAARYASRACRVNSFTPDTRVLMADGTTRDIDDIAVGDLVLAADPDTGQSRAEPVTDLIIGSGEKDLVTITADPDGDGHSGSVVATTGHPFYTDTGWHDAGSLRTDDALFTDIQSTYPVESAVIQPRRHSTVYNLTVADLHTYFVLVDGTPTLVHNCARRAPNWRSGGGRIYKSRHHAEEAARRAARYGGRCSYRGVCSRGDHVHVDYYNRHGQISYTHHYNWRAM